MKHLLPISTTQNIKVIPRVYATSVTLKLRDDSTNDTNTLLVTGVKTGNYISLSSVFDLKEGRFYDFKKFTMDKVLYLNLILFTEIKYFVLHNQQTNLITNIIQ